MSYRTAISRSVLAVSVGLGSCGVLMYYHRSTRPVYSEPANVGESPGPANVAMSPTAELQKLSGAMLWGSNKYGIVDPSNLSEPVIRKPRRLAMLDGSMLRSLDMSEKHAAAVDHKGNVYQWGSGFVDKKHEPQITLSGKNIKQVACNQSWVYALASSGAIYRIAANQNQENQRRHAARQQSWLPWIRDGIEQLRSKLSFVELKTCEDHLIARTGDGQVYLIKSDSSELKKLPSEENIVQVACGRKHVLLRSENGRVYGWGWNQAGQLGLGEVSANSCPFISNPVEIKSIWNVLGSQDLPKSLAATPEDNWKVSHIAASGDSSFFVKSCDRLGSDLLACGCGINGQLGYGSFLQTAGAPVRIKNLSFIEEYDDKLQRMVHVPVIKIIGGDRHIVAFLNTARKVNDQVYGDDVFVWGSNENGECFVDAKTRVLSSPTVMKYTTGDSDAGATGGLDRLQIAYKIDNNDKLVPTMDMTLGYGTTALFSLA